MASDEQLRFTREVVADQYARISTLEARVRELEGLCKAAAKTIDDIARWQTRPSELRGVSDALRALTDTRDET